jgi:aldehyde dehydrogenase (NAD+)
MTISVMPHRDRLNVRPGKILVGADWRDASSNRVWTHHNPATNEPTTDIQFAGPDDVGQAVVAARKAFDDGPWARMKARDRTHVLLRIADLIDKHADELTDLQTLDNAIPIRFGRSYRVSGHLSADIFRHHAGWIDKIAGEVYPQYVDDPNFQFLAVREPIGVAVGITPWNAPLLQFPEKVAPALAAGCCIIMKPSEYASLAVLRMSQLIAEADLPPGVFQVLTGDAETGEALIRHPGVDKISFTGSRAVGEHIQRVAADGIKRVTLELGGKSAAIVFPDCADLPATSAAVMAMMSMFLSGQVCSTTSRAIVHKSIYDEFLQHAGEQVQTVRFGDPFDEGTTSAPMINKRQVEKVMNYIEAGRAEGARLVFGGDRPQGELAQGNWINPTLFADVQSNMRIAQEEIFGPVLVAIPFETEDEAVAIANDSAYGLSSGVYTANAARAWRVARAIRAGTVGINGYSFMPNSPFGGYKASGIGREGGFTSIEAFTEVKTIMFNLSA